MKYDLLKKENGIVEATIQLDAQEWSDSIEKAYQKNKSKYNVQGFRKGHAPRNVIEKTYGQGVFMQDALDEVFYLSYSQILREHEDIKPYEAPKMDIKKLDDKGIEILLEIPCVPEFTLADYKGLEVKKDVKEVTDEQVKNAIDRELMRGSRLVETNKPVKMDDTVTLDFEGFIDGKAFDGGKAERYQLKIGSHSFIDTFEDQLVGMKYDEIEASGLMTPLVELNCKYKRPAYYNQEVEVRTKLIELSPAKFTVEYNIYDKDGVLLNIGRTTLAWADKETFRVVNLKKERPEMYKAFLTGIDNDLKFVGSIPFSAEGYSGNVMLQVSTNGNAAAVFSILDKLMRDPATYKRLFESGQLKY